MRVFVWTAVLTVMTGSAASAQQDATQKAIAAWDNYQDIGKLFANANAKALQAYRKARQNKEDFAEARKKYYAATSKLRKKITKARDQFGEAFLKSDWNSFDVKEQSKLLEAGLSAAAQHAREKGKIDLWIKAKEMLIAKFPKSARARNFKQHFPLLGKEAPNIDSKEWLGADATSLAKLKGKVVVVDFWATWCGPCRAVMPGLSKLYEKHKKDGLVVVGLTRFFANGYLPASPEQMLTGGESVKGMDEKSFLEHVKAFRDNTKITYPFVIGEANNFKDYLVRSIPTVAVVGVDGKVALLAVGWGSDEPLVRAVVERELKKVK